MSKKIVIFTPPLFLIGEIEEWPNKDDFSFGNAAAMSIGIMNTPQGPQQVIQFNWMGDMMFRSSGWTAWREPEAIEEEAYRSFRAARRGISVAGAHELPKPRIIS